jgi:glycosyltransferase involved in cell wall biosynthesis
VKLVWVGDGRLRESFQSHVRKLGLENRVVLEGWRSDARSRMAGFDVFLLPSLYEGFPFAILEAMAAQLPCVVSDVDGNREAIDDGKNGFLCPVNDVASWRNRVTQLIESASCREQMGAASHQRFERDFSLDAMARGTIEVYEKAIARAESARR